MNVVVPVHCLPMSSWALPSRLVQLSMALNISPLSRNLPFVIRIWAMLAAAGAPWTFIGVKRSLLGLRWTRTNDGHTMASSGRPMATSSAGSFHSSSCAAVATELSVGALAALPPSTQMPRMSICFLIT